MVWGKPPEGMIVIIIMILRRISSEIFTLQEVHSVTLFTLTLLNYSITQTVKMHLLLNMIVQAR